MKKLQRTTRLSSPKTTWLITALLTLLGFQPSAALVVYRIGGESLPPPAEVEVGAEFRQLSWGRLRQRFRRRELWARAHGADHAVFSTTQAIIWRRL